MESGKEEIRNDTGVANVVEKGAIVAPKHTDVPFLGKTIVIDAGHGGLDPGSMGSSSGVCESELNLEIAGLLAKELETLGAKTVMTRTEATTRTLGTSNKLSLEERQVSIEKQSADLLLSIHQNFNEESSSYRGVQILYRKESDRAFAERIQNTFNQELSTKLHSIKGEYALLSYGDQPAFIMECGFLSNPQEETLLQQLDHQKRILNILIQGIRNYWDC